MLCEVRHVYKFRHFKHANWQLVLKSSSKQTSCRQRSKSNKSTAKCDECASLEICPKNKNPRNFPGMTNVDHSDKCPNQVTSHSQHLCAFVQDKFSIEFKFWMCSKYYLMSALRLLPVNKLHMLSRWLKTPINRYESPFTNSIYILHSKFKSASSRQPRYYQNVSSQSLFESIAWKMSSKFGIRGKSGFYLN